jgi:hypothetical protein
MRQIAAQATSTSPDDETVAPDRSFSIAFALGWEIASLFWGGSFDSERAEEGAEEDPLPGLAGLKPGERTRLAGNLIEANLHNLAGSLTAVAPVDAACIERLRGELKAGLEDPAPLQRAVRELHLDLLRALTAADLRLGRSYGLGHALAETCLRSRDRDSFERAFGGRLIVVKDWLADLASSFPPHSSRAVVLSLRAWEAWAAHPRIDGQPLVWETHGVGVRDALRRQGELWRDLLAGAKAGEDMLDTNHYLRAASSLVGSMTSTLWRFLKPFRVPLLIAVPLFLAGVALLLFSDTAGKAFGAILAAAGAIGITGAGLRARLGKVAGELQSRLWGAELDFAVAEAVLIGPEGWRATVAEVMVPPTGTEPKVAENLAVLDRFRKAVADRRAAEVRALLAPDVEFAVGDGEPLCDPKRIAEWILAGGDGSSIATTPQKIEAVGPAALITQSNGRSEVWRVKERKVRRWEAHRDVAGARDAARRNA